MLMAGSEILISEMLGRLLIPGMGLTLLPEVGQQLRYRHQEQMLAESDV